MTVTPSAAPRVGLRGRLLALTVGLVTLSFAGVWWIATGAAREGLTELTQDNLDLSATNLADAVTRSLGEAHADAITSARLDLAAEAVESGDPKNFVWYADGLVRSKQKYTAFLVTDEQGQVVGANTQQSDGRKPPALLRRRTETSPWFEAAYSAPAGQPILIELSQPEVLNGWLENESVLGFGLPVLDILQERIGSLIVFCSSRYLGRLLGDVRRRDDVVTSAALIVDSAGVILIAPEDALGWRGARIDLAQRRWLSPTGEEFWIARAPIEGPVASWGWSIVTLKTAAALEAPVGAITDRLSWVFLVALMLASVSLAAAASRIVAPIRRLTGAATSTGRASEFSELPVYRGDEVGMLTQAFNRMMTTIREHENKLEEKVAERTRELAAAKKEVTDILDHMAEGIFTVGAQRRVNPAFSASCLQIFGDVPIAGRDVLELLQVDAAAKPETHSRMRFWLDHIIGSDELQWMMVEDQPPRALTYNRPGESAGVAFLELAYAPIYEGDAITKVMVIAKDVTQLRGLESEIKAKDEQHRQSLERVSELVSLEPELFNTFVQEAEGLFAQSKDALAMLRADPSNKEGLHRLFRVVHTLKGNARVFKMSTIQNAAHALEEHLHPRREANTPLASADVDEIEQRVQTLAALVGDFRELGLRVLASRGHRAENRGPTLRVPESRIMEVRHRYKELVRRIDEAGAAGAPFLAPGESLGEALLELTRVPVGTMVERYRKMVLDLAGELNKRVEDLDVRGGEVEVDTKLVDLMRDVLLHALRNAVDHGIEPPDERQRLGKEPKGSIRVTCSVTDDMLLFDVSDDGRGIDLARVRRTAFEKGFLSEEQLAVASEADLLNLLFAPGFTTAERVTEVSGRGVGMDIIRSTLRALRGEASVHSQLGQGTTLTLRIPIDYYQRL